jgi:hypothetical protein
MLEARTESEIYSYVTLHGTTRTLTREEWDAENPYPLPLPAFVLRRDSPGRIACRKLREQEERTLRIVVGIVVALCITAVVWGIST